jgi:hypothetical protein
MSTKTSCLLLAVVWVMTTCLILLGWINVSGENTASIFRVNYYEISKSARCNLLFANKTSRKFSWGTFFDKVNANLWMLLCKVMYFQSIMSVDNVSPYVDKESNEAFQTHQIIRADNLAYPCWTARAEVKQSCCVFWGRLPWDFLMVFLTFCTKILKRYLNLCHNRFLSYPFRFSMNSSWRLDTSTILQHVAW